MTEMTADVVVIGAGPAGCAAAAVLGDDGCRVVLADRAHAGRDKVCGDGLLPDALAALSALGVAAEVEAAGRRVGIIRMRSARGRELALDVPSVVVRRRHLDAIVLERARRSGATFLGEASLLRFRDDERGARAAVFRTPGGELACSADAFVLATGANPQARALAGLGEVAGRPAVALRGYARCGGLSGDELLIELPAQLPGGYAWAFPGPDEIWNVGCGVVAGMRPRQSLRKVLQWFLERVGATGFVEEPNGAPLLTTFPRVRVAAGDVLAVGDAAGLTRPFSGEGIGPALESGVIAARCLLEHRVRAAEEYTRRLYGRFAADFRAWRFGERFLRFPTVIDAIVVRAARHRGAQRRCAALLGGTVSTSSVLSPVGLLRLMIGR